MREPSWKQPRDREGLPAAELDRRLGAADAERRDLDDATRKRQPDRAVIRQLADLGADAEAYPAIVEYGGNEGERDAELLELDRHLVIL